MIRFTLASAFAPADMLPPDIRLIVLVAFAFCLAVTIGGLLLGHQKEKLRHETIRLALEKGQPVPPGMVASARHASPRPRNDRRNGLILVAIAVGLFCFLFAQGKPASAFAACIPAAIGLALLFNASCEEKERRKDESRLPKI